MDITGGCGSLKCQCMAFNDPRYIECMQKDCAMTLECESGRFRHVSLSSMKPKSLTKPVTLWT